MHALEVLQCFSPDAASLGVGEIARRIQLHKSTVSRLLSTLESARFVERETDTGRYRLGLGLIRLAAPLLSSMRLIDIARPYLQELAKRSGETLSLNIWDGDGAVTVEQIPGANAVRHFAPLGMHNPAHCTASGKALLAHAPEADIERLLGSGLKGYTSTTPVSRDAVLSELREIRNRGYAVNEGELVADVGAVASPVRDVEGKVVAAVTATVPLYRFDAHQRAELTRLILETTHRISERLGYFQCDKRSDLVAGSDRDGISITE